ncbi:MAG: hypothetical protein ABIG69_06970 [Bacteroidota bacterium]
MKRLRTQNHWAVNIREDIFDIINSVLFSTRCAIDNLDIKLYRLEYKNGWRTSVFFNMSPNHMPENPAKMLDDVMTKANLKYQ